LPGWRHERVGAERALYHVRSRETAGSSSRNNTIAFLWSMKMGSGAIPLAPTLFERSYLSSD